MLRRDLIAAGSLVLALVAAMGFFRWTKSVVDRRAAAAESAWSIELPVVPDWLRAGCAGQLATLESMPGEISLRSPHWREEILTRLAEIRWVTQVHALENEGDRIRFDFDIARPVIAVADEAGYALADSTGRVIDRTSFEAFDPRWGIPRCEFDRAGRAAIPGAKLAGEEMEQLVSIAAEIAQAGYLDRWPGAIAELTRSEWLGREPIWCLRLANGALIEWGDAPASRLPRVLETSDQLRNLASVLCSWSSLDSGTIVEICCREPMVRTQ